MNFSIIPRKTVFILLAITLTPLCSTQAMQRVLFNQSNTEENLVQYVGNIVKLWSGENESTLDKDSKGWLFGFYEKAKKTFYKGEDGGLSLGKQWKLYNYAKFGVYGVGGLASWETSSFSLDLKKQIRNLAPVCISFVGWQVNKKLNEQCKECEETFMEQAENPLTNLSIFLEHEKKRGPFKIPSKTVTGEKLKIFNFEITTLKVQRDLLPPLHYASAETLLPLTNVKGKMTKLILLAQQQLPQSKK